MKTKATKNKSSISKKALDLIPIKEGILFSTLPAKRRLIFRWCEATIIVAILLTVWLLMTKEVTGALIGVAVISLALFAGVGVTVSLVLRKNTIFVFTDGSIVVRSGVTEILDSRLPYSEIAIFKKVVGLPDILTKRETATFKMYKIKTKNNGKKVLVQDQVCSLYGVKKHREISKLLEEKNVPVQKKLADKRAIKKRLALEWKQLKAERKAKEQEQKAKEKQDN